MKMKKIATIIMAAVMAMAPAVNSFAAGFTGGDNVLSVSTNFEVKTLVPWAASEENAFLVLNQAEEGLFRMDADNKPQPALCESYEVSDDKLTYTFHLREGIQWNNGTPVTASDFVFAWLKQMSADATNGYSFIMNDYIVNGYEYNEGSVEADEVGVKAVDDSTLEVQLTNPTPYFLNLTTMVMFFPVNEEFYNEVSDQFTLTPDKMLYCGPYVITEYDPAVGVTFAANDNYWDKDSVQIADAKVRVMKDSTAALSAYQAGELSQVELDSVNVLANQDSPEFSRQTDFRTTYIQFNLTDPVMSNVNIRKAISLAIDRQTLTDKVLADGSAPGFGLVADGMSGDAEKTFRELNGDVSPFDAEKAKEYYDKGVEELGSAPSEVTLLVADDSVSKSVATFIQSELDKNLGLTMVIDTKTVQGRGELMDANNYQFGLTAWGADYDDAMTYLDLWTNGTPYRGNYTDDTYNSLISDAKSQTDDATRLTDMLEAEKKLVDEDAVVSPIYHRGSATLTKSNVKNLISHPIGVPMEFKYAYFE
ncbi:peptide ABC transporter substrate-binding protein [Ruminococcus sp. 5_1_39BFAA]|uniref:peptide ABC transporter substrate-binding protein n=1 Tax=Ruminococcus sp. 5_1_39BFAA TaxID=457412 RepID=UPI0035629F27